MRPKVKSRDEKRNKEAGFSLVVVIVLLLFLSMSAGALSSILTTSSCSGLNHLNAAQAFYTAQAGLCWGLKNNGGTSAPVPFGEGSFEVDKYYFRFEATAVAGRSERKVRANRTVEYLKGTREGPHVEEDVQFVAKNQTGDWVELTHFKLEWAEQVAYFEKLKMRYAKNYEEFLKDNWESWKTLFDKGWNGGLRGASGVKYVFKDYKSYWIESGEPVQFFIEDFESAAGGGSNVDMRSIPFKLTLYGPWGSTDYEYPPAVVGVE